MIFDWKSSAVTTGVILLLVCTGYGNPIIIDEFSDNNFSLLVTGAAKTASASQSNVSGVLGGERDVFLEWLAGGGVLRARTILNASYEEVAFYNNDTNVVSELTFTYDGMEDYDLTGGGAALGIEILLTYSDRDATVDVTVTSSGGSSSASADLPISDDPISVFLLFSDFTGSGDFEDVDAISFMFTGEDSLDLGIDEFGQHVHVPEPATVILLASGLAAGTLARRARRRR